MPTRIEKHALPLVSSLCAVGLLCALVLISNEVENPDGDGDFELQYNTQKLLQQPEPSADNGHDETNEFLTRSEKPERGVSHEVLARGTANLPKQKPLPSLKAPLTLTGRRPTQQEQLMQLFGASRHGLGHTPLADTDISEHIATRHEALGGA